MSNQQQEKSLQGKVAVVTGASSGIGLAIAQRLAKAGASVVLAARREDKLKEAKQTIEKNGGKAISVKTDVTVRQEVKDLIKTAESTFGPVDIMVNNAGVFCFTLMKNVKEDEWDRMIDVNCKPMAGVAVYTGSKHFVEGLSKCLRLELEGTEVRVTCLQVGNTDTEIFANVVDQEAMDNFDMKYPNFNDAKMLTPDDVARAVVYAVTQPPYVAVNEIQVQPTDFYIQ